jgi:hypothetical protein
VASIGEDRRARRSGSSRRARRSFGTRAIRETDYADARPIATVALEVASTNEPLRQATADVFESWIACGTERFTAAGLPEEPARELAINMIGALEGAFVLSRALRTTEPLEAAARAMSAAVRAASESTA